MVNNQQIHVKQSTVKQSILEGVHQKQLLSLLTYWLVVVVSIFTFALRDLPTRSMQECLTCAALGLGFVIFSSPRIAAPLAVFLAIVGGFINPAFVVAAGWIMLRCYPAESATPFPRFTIGLLAWVVSELLIEIVRYLQAPFDIREWLMQSPRLLRQVEIVVSFVLLSEVARRPKAVTMCTPWLAPALVISLLMMLGQALFVFHLPYSLDIFGWHLSPFFAQQGRLSGSFVDPNSAGIVLALSACFFWKNPWKYFGPYGRWFSGLLIIGMLLTGSRSGLIAVVLFGLVQLGRRFPTSKHVWTVRLGLLALCALATLILINTIALEELKLLPVGVTRLVASLRMESLSDANFSRVALWHVAAAQWEHYPLLGVGLDRYRELLPPFAQTLAIPIGAWSDNPGSWPIFLLVELGLIGALLFVADLLQIKSSGRSGAMIWIALAVLLFGCHTHDPAVAIAYGALLASDGLVSQESNKALGYRSLLAPWMALLVVPFVAISALRFPRGFYPWEFQAGTLSKWSGGHASLMIPCEGGAPQLRSLNPHGPQQVELATGRLLSMWNDPISQNVTVDTQGQSVAPLVCQQGSALSRLMQMHVVSTWIPSKNGLGTDPRSLGVLLEYHLPLPLDDL